MGEKGGDFEFGLVSNSENRWGETSAKSLGHVDGVQFPATEAIEEPEP